ncbi:Fe-Mn family superoxide dismutase [Candidatus Micrarchaeota archaeon]|nr:Fe-Mn family superoxide dismutase [Candidatus Micrarchaeota archaeon]
MEYQAKNFDGLLGMEGFSDTLLKNHFTLYAGYVANTNKVADALAAMAKEGRGGTPEYAELKRRFGWEFNGMRLHELYFGNMANGGSKPDAAPELAKALAGEFGSLEGWEKDFRATGAMRGIGWVVLYYDQTGKRLFNMWINEHDAGHPSGCAPILVMDVFEHAYMTDYGLKRADYIGAFFRNLDWEATEARFAKATA